MFALRNLSLTQFKNYETASFRFDERVVGICGLNGVGKTNLMDAIHYCCMAKSYFHTSDQLNVFFGKDGFRLVADFEKKGQLDHVICVMRAASKKEVAVNQIQHEKLSQHIGLYPCVMVVPDDIEIINGAGEVRRKLIDVLLSQLFPDYLQALILHNKILQQRNSFLKSLAFQSHQELSVLDALDYQMQSPAQIIHLHRANLSVEFILLVNQFYEHISGAKEKIALTYKSRLNEIDFSDLLRNNRLKDMQQQRTTEGLHRDDWILELEGHSFKSTASQGQKKSLLFAIKIAEHAMLTKHKGFPPLLLLDDVFEKLDEDRMKNLLHYVCTEAAGQVFITDTHQDRIVAALREQGVEMQVIAL
jgi:DNA replication and repair protein RecF